MKPNNFIYFRGMLSRWLNAEPVVNRPVMVGYMVGPNADEADGMTDVQLKDKGNNLFEWILG